MHAQQQISANMPTQNPQLNHPLGAQNQPIQVTPQTKMAARVQHGLSNSTGNITTKGTKRPNEETVAEAGGDAAVVNATRSRHGVNLTQDQLSKVSPAQQAQVKAQLLKAQDASNNKMQQRSSMPSVEEMRARMQDPIRLKQYRQLVEEVEKSLPVRPTVTLSPQLRFSLQKSLKEQLSRLKQVDQALRLFHATYDNAESDLVMRQIINSRALLFQQMNEADGTLHAQVTLTTDEFKNHLGTVIKFVRAIMEKMTQQKNQNGTVQQSQPSQGSSAPPAQLNAANLKIVEQQQRQPKPPQAPTTDRPPFPIGAESGHGVATYFEGARSVTNLVLPEKKRAKLEAESQTPTPGAKASPRIGLGLDGSPDLKKQQLADKSASQRLMFRCNAAECEYSVRGFETQAELETHVSQAHSKIDDPLQFALDSMSEYLDVDPKTGQPRVDPHAAKRDAKETPMTTRAPVQAAKQDPISNLPQQGAMPSGPQAAATPTAPVPAQPGTKGSPSNNLLKTPQAMSKGATPSTGPQGKPTLSTFARPMPKEPSVAVVEPESEATQQVLLPMSLLDYSYEDTFAALDASQTFTALDLKDEDTAWALRSRPASPSTTPESSSKDTPSTRQSDISENDNLLINLDLKDADVPDAWAGGLCGDGLPLDMQLSDDMQSLGVILPPMDTEDMMLFPTYGSDNTMDLEMLDASMDSVSGALDIAGLS